MLNEVWFAAVTCGSWSILGELNGLDSIVLGVSMELRWEVSQRGLLGFAAPGQMRVLWHGSWIQGNWTTVSNFPAMGKCKYYVRSWRNNNITFVRSRSVPVCLHRLLMAGLQSQSSWREVLPSPSVLKFESCFLVFPLAVLIMLYSHLVQNHLAQSHPSSLLEGICSTIITVYIFFILLVCVYGPFVCVYVRAPHVCTSEVMRGHHILWDWSYRWSWAMWGCWG